MSPRGIGAIFICGWRFEREGGRGNGSFPVEEGIGNRVVSKEERATT